MHEDDGFTLLQLMTAMAILGILAVIAMPAFNSIRLASAHASAKEILVSELNRARWMAINSGQPRIVELTSETVLTIRDPAFNALVSADFSDYGVTLNSTLRNTPERFELDGRGFLPPDQPSVTFSITSVPISQTATVTLGPLGKVVR